MSDKADQISHCMKIGRLYLYRLTCLEMKEATGINDLFLHASNRCAQLGLGTHY
jgi:hypothetical protein